MKKKLFFAAMALVALASCTSDEFVGVEIPQDNSPSESNAIVFSSASKGVTRADIVGADAATLLGEKFVVGGFKGTSTAATNVVFDNYNVQWGENSAGTTESNTSDWEYVGIAFNSLSGIYDANSKQTIKYWDYSQTLYDFVAYSLGQGTTFATATTISPTNHSFTLKGDETELTQCYVADRVTVKKADFGKEVTLNFRNLAAKVRMALYETVPGYSVKDVQFYSDNTTLISADISNKTSATLIGTFNTGGTYTVTYPGVTEGESDYNKAHVAIASTGDDDYRDTFGSLVYTSKENKEKNGTKFLGRTSSTASFAGTSPFYQTVLPNEDGEVMELRINYTLEAIDGSGEEIHIYGAKAYVPSTYTQWLPNYAYTYIFKISDNTNGWTSKTDTDPDGLYPITFDAVVIDSEQNEQTTITNVATPSITTYQKDHIYSDGTDEDNGGKEYAASKGDIYVQVMTDDVLASNLNKKNASNKDISCLYTLSGKENPSEADVMDALNIQENTNGQVVTGRNGLVLTPATINNEIVKVPGVDGNDIDVTKGTAASFTPSAGTYAYVYFVSDENDKYIYSAVNLTAEPSDWGAMYYKDPNGATPAGTYADGTYYKKYTNSNIVYGVKVIKVK